MADYKEVIIRDVDTINNLLDEIATDITLANNNLEVIHGVVSRIEYVLYEEINNDQTVTN